MQKRALALFLSPLFISLSLQAAAAFARHRRRLALVLATLSMILLWAAGTDLVAERLIGALEKWPLPAPPAELPLAREIVVLGAGLRPPVGAPPVARLRPASLARLNEGLRQLKLRPGARLLLAGGRTGAGESEAAAMAALALALGAAPGVLDLEELSQNTEDQAALLGPKLKGRRFQLVTSAWHLPRAVALFQRAGASPLPVPADFLGESRAEAALTDWIPQSRSLAKTEVAVYEGLALAWLQLRTAWGPNRP